jgi:hypothetical protein
MNTSPLPDEQTEEEIMEAFRKVVHDASEQVRTDEQRDAVMSALYDVIVRVDEDL